MKEQFNSPPKLTRPRFSGAIISIIISCGIFLLLPIIQAIDSTREATTISLSNIQMPPPPPPPPPPPKQEEQEEEEVEKMEEERQPPSIDQLEVMLQGDISDSLGGGVRVPTFDIGDSLGDIVFEIGDLDQIPELIPGSRNPQDFRYPHNLKRAGIGGQVSLIFIVDEEGNVRRPYVEKATHDEFKQPAVDWVKKWKFRPGEKGGRKVKTRMRIPLKFTI